jgi:hypothetical protein
VGIADRNDYERLQVYGGRLWMMSRAGGTGGASAMYRFTGAPTASVAKPAELFRGTTTALWNVSVGAQAGSGDCFSGGRC